MSPLVPDFILQQDALGKAEGSFTAAVLIVDISGFTEVTERMMEHARSGAELLAETLRFYFDPLIAAVHQAGGFIIGFAGDSFTAIFPETPDRKVAEYALGAAVAMRRFFNDHPERETVYGSFPFSFKIAITWGAVEWGIVRISKSRAYHHFVGPAIQDCLTVIRHAHRGDILVDRAFCDRIPPASAKAVQDVAGIYKLGTEIRLPIRAPVSRPDVPGDGLAFLPPGVSDMPLEGEFRNVTSVFLSFDNIPTLNELTRLLHELGELYGGTFTGIYLGDMGMSALIHFGAPIAHENDNDRALDFALELKKRGLRSMRLRAGITRDVRYAGFNGGTESREFACLGRATNLAARLVMKAPWGAIWADEQVFRAGETSYQWTTENIFRFKGFDLPILVYSLERRRISVQKEFYDLGLIGRENELEQIARAIDPIFEGRPAGILYVEGEPGLGKSYLVQRYRHRLEEHQDERPFVWIDARCDQTLQSSLNAFEFALKEYFWESSAIGKEEKLTNFEDALEYLLERLPESQAALRREIERAKSIFAALIGIRWDDSPYERLHPKLRYTSTLSALSFIFLAECSLQPVILHLEDAHWADEDSLEAVRVILRACRGLPIAVLITTRRKDDGTPVRIPLDPDIRENAVELKPLTRDQLLALAVPFFGGPMPDMLATLLCETAGGNPFFAQEILAFWLEDGRYGSSSSSISISNTFMPPKNVNSLLISRLDRLDARVKQTIVAAAVLGREFDLRVLRKMLPDSSVLEEHVRIGEAQCIWSGMTEHRFQFSNALLRNAAYEMQSRARLQELHRLAAEAIESLYGDDIEDQLVALGRHWRRAGKIDQARRYFLAGARKAAARYAHEEATRLYRVYFKLSPEPTPESVVVRYEFARDVLEARGRFQEARQEHIRVLTEAQKLRDRATEALGFLGLGRAHWAMQQPDEARTFWEEGLLAARDGGAVPTEGLLHGSLGMAFAQQAHFDTARNHYNRAITLAGQIGNRREEGRLLNELAKLHRQSGRPGDAVACQERAAAIERELGASPP
ncbi:MAG TPA: AAA family ATPase [Candidatus Nanopelagicales bacterium]|nr:AAA family ATPase [Candidatus Nanopelagicales bacterium]